MLMIHKRSLAIVLALTFGGAPGCGAGGASNGVINPDGGSDAGGSGGCHSTADCKASTFETCGRVEDPVCGGAVPRPCTSDQECADAGSNGVCVDTGCGVNTCIPKCASDQDCGSNPAGALTCNLATGKCAPKACTQSSECPANFTCGGSAGCVTKSCTTDSECSVACVNGLCSSAPGVCREPAG